MAAWAILGGTGAQGLGLALRLAAAGEAVRIGSRSLERAREAAGKVTRAVPGADATGFENSAAAAETDRILLTFPADGLVPALDAFGAALAGKLVVDVMVPLAFHHGRAEIAPLDGRQSLGEIAQARVPSARVVSAFKNVSADLLQDLSQKLAGDVLVCGEDKAARREVIELAGRIPDLRGIDAGHLANARSLEAITALLVNLNRQHHARTSVAIVGLDPKG